MRIIRIRKAAHPASKTEQFACCSDFLCALVSTYQIPLAGSRRPSYPADPPPGGCFLSLCGSLPLEQAKKQTDGAQTRANTRLLVLNAQEGSREQREKNARMRAWNGDFRRAVLKRPWRETVPTLGELAKKKSQPDKGWDFEYWWWMVDHRTTFYLRSRGNGRE